MFARYPLIYSVNYRQSLFVTFMFINILMPFGKMSTHRRGMTTSTRHLIWLVFVGFLGTSAFHASMTHMVTVELKPTSHAPVFRHTE